MPRSNALFSQFTSSQHKTVVRAVILNDSEAPVSAKALHLLQQRNLPGVVKLMLR
jgi:hypothetical protein